MRGSSRFSLCLCACKLSCPAVCMLTTLILCVEPLAWEHDALRLLPPRSLPLPHSSSHCLVRNSFCCEVKKNTKRRSHISPTALNTWAVTEFLKCRTKHHRVRRTNKVMTCCGEDGVGGWHWIRPQSESMCVQDGVIQTCSVCVSPHERREQNGIKLDQERVYFSKRKQDGGHWSIGYNASTLLFLGSILWIALRSERSAEAPVFPWSIIHASPVELCLRGK